MRLINKLRLLIVTIFVLAGPCLTVANAFPAPLKLEKANTENTPTLQEKKTGHSLKSVTDQNNINTINKLHAPIATPRLLPIMHRARGGESSGGGGVVDAGGTPVLVDFINLSKSLQESSLNSTLANSFIPHESSQPFFFDPSAVPTDPAFHCAHQTLLNWQAVPFGTVSFLVNFALEAPLQWSFTDKIKQHPFFYRPKNLDPNLEILTAAFYVFQKPKLFTVQINRMTWNKMNLYSQAGLLIHEILRHVQIGIGNDFNDEMLQKATAIFMSCQPSVKLDQYLNLIISNQADLAESRFGDFDSIIKACKVRM